MKKVLAVFLAALCSIHAAHAANRMTVYLDGGVPITVDNISGYSASTIQTLVLAADRSTTDGCPFDPPDIKGLIQPGDRVVISDNYIAWLDFTVDQTGFAAQYSRSGELA